MSPFDYFDEIYCINLEHRPERWKQAQREFDKVGIVDRVRRFDAIYDKENPKRGCYESHMGGIRLAHKRKLKNVLIFEDDVTFLDCYSEQKFSKSIETLKTKEWDFFYIGGLEKRIFPRRGYRPLKERGLAEYDEEFDYLMKCSSVGWRVWNESV
jgi:glycosyl transferase family 25